MSDKKEVERLATYLASIFISDEISAVKARAIAALLRQLSAERDQLRAEVERLRADAERLDWIEHQYLEDLVMGLAVDCEHDGQYYVSGDDNKTGYGDSLRDAIDSARTTHKDPA